jgi:hypothetical protein
MAFDIEGQLSNIPDLNFGRVVDIGAAVVEAKARGSFLEFRKKMRPDLVWTDASFGRRSSPASLQFSSLTWSYHHAQAARWLVFSSVRAVPRVGSYPTGGKLRIAEWARQSVKRVFRIVPFLRQPRIQKSLVDRVPVGQLGIYEIHRSSYSQVGKRPDRSGRI